LLAPRKALGKIFRKADRFEMRELRLDEEQLRRIEEVAGISFGEGQSGNIMMYTAYRGDAEIGYAFEDTVVGKWGPIHYLVGMHPKGAIAEVIILDYDEIRGKGVAKKRYLRQYTGKDTGDPIQLRRDINGITGATISSRALTDGVRKITHIFPLVVADKE
jgi:Na+-translocating ferredoxin:NAD+ oxidoreductase RnfG subunit